MAACSPSEIESVKFIEGNVKLPSEEDEFKLSISTVWLVDEKLGSSAF